MITYFQTPKYRFLTELYPYQYISYFRPLFFDIELLDTPTLLKMLQTNKSLGRLTFMLQTPLDRVWGIFLRAGCKKTKEIKGETA